MATIRRNKSILAVQMLVAKTQWLSGHHYWEKDTVVWRTADATLSPQVADLSRAQRTLNRITNYPNAARTVLGDPELWLDKRREALELAKRLHNLPSASILQTQQPTAAVCTRLCAMLVAEALCLNDIDPSPCRSLLAAGALSLVPLPAMLSDGAVPMEARALAALTLGALESTSGAAGAISTVPVGTALWRAATWGRTHGLPPEPVLVSRLLIDKDGIGLADAYCKSAQSSSAFTLSPPSLRKLLADGVAPATVLSLCQAAVDCEPIARSLMRYREELSDLTKARHLSREVKGMAAKIRASRLDAVRRIAHFVQEYAAGTGDPQVVRLLSAFVLRALSFADEIQYRSQAIELLMESIDIALTSGMKLPPELQGQYFELLAKRHDFLWNTPDLPQNELNNCAIRRLTSWLATGFNQQIEPARALLAACGDHATAADCITLNIHRTRTLHRWQDPKMFRLAVDMTRYFGLDRREWPIESLFRVLDLFKTAREFQQLLSPIVQSLEPHPEQMRKRVLIDLMREVGTTRQEILNWPRIVGYVPLITRTADQVDNSTYFTGPLVRLAIKLDEQRRERAKPLLTWVIGLLGSRTANDQNAAQIAFTLRIAIELALPLAAGDEGALKSIFQTALQHRLRHNFALIKGGLETVKDLPVVMRSIAQLFPTQPQRIVELLARMSATSKLRIDVPALMSVLEPQSIIDNKDGAQYPILLQRNSDWWRLHKVAPNAIGSSNTFLHAAWLSNAPQDLPSSVRKILDRPERMARELEHVERQVLSNPERADLAARAVKLAAALQDRASLLKAMQAEITERLQHAAALAHIDALEQRIVACYRSRLEIITGPLRPDLVFTSDLINATLMTVDIACNRRLLLTLIRAHIDEDSHWRENHPANAAFLADLVARGADASVWLSAFPRRYASPAIPGKWIHFSLETDPLHILQMGNYFDTCLSFGGCNSFSTVANAVELNKRVIYARDAYSRVVGRKLIGLNEAGELLGFHTYCSLTDGVANDALQVLFHRYAKKFAAKCGLQTSDGGAIPKLFAEEWYDDGSISWSTETEPHHHSSNNED